MAVKWNWSLELDEGWWLLTALKEHLRKEYRIPSCRSLTYLSEEAKFGWTKGPPHKHLRMPQAQKPKTHP